MDDPSPSSAVIGIFAVWLGWSFLRRIAPPGEDATRVVHDRGCEDELRQVIQLGDHVRWWQWASLCTGIAALVFGVSAVRPQEPSPAHRGDEGLVPTPLRRPALALNDDVDVAAARTRARALR
jgi:hypothetical protein